jgi:hypothetical protein
MKSKARDRGALQDWRAEGAPARLECCFGNLFLQISNCQGINVARGSLNFVAAQTLMQKQNLNDIP